MSGQDFKITEALSEDRTLTAEIKLYYDLHAPFLRDDKTPHPLLVALHGYGAHKRQMMREARRLAPEGFAVASLQGPYQYMKEPKEKGGPWRFAFGWLTNFRPEESVALHHRALLNLIGTLVTEGVADRNRIFLLGFSQTCALNFRFAFTHAEILRGVVGICGGLPGDWETGEAYKQTGASVLYLSGERDEFYPPERVKGYEEHLRLRATDVEARSYVDAGHEIVEAMRLDVRAWLESRAK